MKKLIHLFIYIAVLTACSRQHAFDQLLAEADSMNVNYIPFTTDSILRSAVEYYNHQGTANERMHAYYLLGCAYRDMGEAPQALQAYHDAAGCADTTAADCDYQLLCRVHSQTASLFYQQYLPHEMLEELRLQYRCAKKIHNELYAINAHELMGNAYELMQDTDSVILIRKEVYRQYAALGEHEMAAISLGGLLPAMIDKQQYDSVAHYMEIYEKETHLFDEEGFIQADHQIYYYIKGKYHLGTGNVQLADSCFRLLLSVARNDNERQGALQGLAMCFQVIHQPDSTAKYLILSQELNDSMFYSSTAAQLHHSHQLYNYKRNQLIAIEKEQEATHNRNMLYMSLATMVVIIVIAASVYQNIKRQRAHDKERYYQHIMQMQQAQYDLKALHNKDVQSLITEKEQLIAKYEQQLKQFKQLRIHQHHPVLEEQIVTSAIYKKFHQLTVQPLRKPTYEEWKELTALIDCVIPRFHGILNSGLEPLKDAEYEICMLIRLHFSASVICNLTGSPSSTVATTRKRLLLKVFGIEGSPKDFDILVRDIT